MKLVRTGLLVCSGVLAGTCALAEHVLVVTRVETYQCINPLTYRSIADAAKVSYQAAHERAEAALRRDCTKVVEYRHQWPATHNRVSFLGLTNRSHLEVEFQSRVIVRTV